MIEIFSHQQSGNSVKPKEKLAPVEPCADRKPQSAWNAHCVENKKKDVACKCNKGYFGRYRIPRCKNASPCKYVLVISYTTGDPNALLVIHNLKIKMFSFTSQKNVCDGGYIYLRSGVFSWPV